MNKKFLSSIVGISILSLSAISSASASSSNTYYINNYLYPTSTYSPASCNGFTYFITKPSELNWISYKVTQGYTFQNCTLEITNDIDFSNVGFVPIGTYYHHFQGTIRGNGHKIENLKINCPGYYGVGVVGYLGVNGTVKGLDVSSSCNFVGYGNVGGIVGCNAGLVEHCSSQAKLFAISDFVGGIVGYNSPNGKVIDCEVGVLGERASGVNRKVNTFIGDNEGCPPINCRTFFFFPW